MGRHFGPQDANAPRGFDPDLHLLAAHPQHGDHDVVADLDLLLWLPRENQHGTLLCSKREGSG
jgi:hypothetical protein